MARSLNRVMLIGNLTQDPEVRQTPNGQNVCTVGLATNRTWKDASGSQQERAEFHNVVMWGKLAEIAGQYLRKGKQVYIEGRIETRSWDAQDGQKKYRTEIIAESMLMLGSKDASDRAPAAGTGMGAGAAGFGAAAVTMQSMDGSDMSAPMPIAPTKDEIRIEDIPF